MFTSLIKKCLGFAILLTGPALLAQDVLVQMDDIYPQEIRLSGFVLDREQELDVEVVGPHRRGKHNIYGFSWILNADTREVVWELTDANSKWRSRLLREYRDEVTLKPGTYEVYYAIYPYQYYYYSNDGDEDWSFMRFFFNGNGDKEEYRDEDFKDFAIKILGSGRTLDRSEVVNRQRKLQEKAPVSLISTRDEKYETQGFTLDKDLDLIVYMLGEARDDGSFDYGWIIDTETQKKVWRFDYYDSDHAGGNEKNRMIRETISLPKGKYAAFYVTDDSHSPREWNSPPPYDPAFWGISIYTENDDDARFIKRFDYEDMPVKNIILDLTRMRDNEYVSKGITLKKDTNVRIHAVGEGSRGEMYDYGWIVDAKDRRRVWEMDYRDTEHAGGSSKNRLFDDVITLKKGDYIVHFVTDDSHSYRDWNSSAPYDSEKWGILLLGADNDFKSSTVAEYEPSEDKSIIVKLDRMRDWEKKREDFKLDRDSRIRIYALGEGSAGSMYDYGWITDKNGRTVWEMTYRKTDHAGGADKNRIFDDTILLEAGEYTVHYESDDSHSFREWNSSPPRDPAAWGITLYKVDK